MLNQEDRLALKALGIKTNVLYTVVSVGCEQKDCIHNEECQDNAIGLTEDENGGYMICHNFRTDQNSEEIDKKVFWRRKP